MYVLHIGNKNYSSWSLRPWVLMKTLGIPFEEKLHRFVPGGWGPEFKSVLPNNLVPVLDDGDTKVWESLGIVEYLAERHPTVWPTDRKARAWARSAASEMHGGFSALRNACSMNVGLRISMPGIPPALQANLDRLDALWADGFDRFGGPFLAGPSFTAVDAFFCPVAFRVQTYGLPLSDRSLAYVDRLLALPAMQDWYKAGIAEDFRDPPHEADVKAAGEWTADYRAAEKV